MTGAWQHFPHGADVGVRGLGTTLAEAFAAAGCALTAAQVDLEAVRPSQPVEIICRGTDFDDLLYVWLNTLIGEMAVRRMVFARFEVSVNACQLHAVAWGEPLSVERHHPAVEVKGATYTGLDVRREGDRWIAECVVDV